MSKKKTNKRFSSKLPEGQLVSDFDEFKELENNNPQIIQTDEIIDPSQLFSNESGQTDNNVAKELFNIKNPKGKTELIKDEDKDVALLYEMSRKYYEPRGILMLKDALDEFVLLRFSKDRKSREEFVRAHQELQRQKQGNFIDQMLGKIQ
jgi:hypothetical protein